MGGQVYLGHPISGWPSLPLKMIKKKTQQKGHPLDHFPLSLLHVFCSKGGFFLDVFQQGRRLSSPLSCVCSSKPRRQGFTLSLSLSCVGYSKRAIPSLLDVYESAPWVLSFTLFTICSRALSFPLHHSHGGPQFSSRTIYSKRATLPWKITHGFSRVRDTQTLSLSPLCCEISAMKLHTQHTLFAS